MKIKSYSGIVTGAVAATTFLVAPARAANVEVRNLEVRSGEGKVELALNLAPGDSLGDGTPQVSTTQKDRAMITEIANAQLNLGNGQEIFSQENPLPGIERIEVMEAAPGKVHIVALGEVAAPTGEILSQDSNEILLNVVSGAPTATAQAAEASTVIEPTLLAQSGPNISNPNDFLQPAAPVPPFLPRASAPPVGDISISTIDTRIPSYVNLGTNAVIPRLVLKDAPVEDVLGLLARSANLNVVLQEDVGDVTIRSLDLENEPVQDAFSYVLMLSDLKAVMKGRTIFVGKDLPNAIVPSITRTFRLNQIKVEAAKAYLENGSTGFVRSRFVTATAGTGETSSIQATVESEFSFTGESEGSGSEEESQGHLQALLSQLEIRTDERLNSITISGEPRIVEIASVILQQLDARKRQVAVNVKVLDVSLSGDRSISSDIALLLDDRFGVDATRGIILSPNGEARDTISSNNPDIASRQTNLSGSLVANLISQGNTKIVADPTLIIQENETSEIRLTDQILAGVKRTLKQNDAGVVIEEILEPQIEDVGLIVPISIDSVDDNGFISMNISSELSGIGDIEVLSDGNIVTLKRQSVINSGMVRLRDNQTLLLAGVIDEREFVETSKVPILGDIPIIGSLFRNSSRNNTRRELLFIITPQIIDDSMGVGWGYGYQPSEATRDLLGRQNFPTD